MKKVTQRKVSFLAFVCLLLFVILCFRNNHFGLGLLCILGCITSLVIFVIYTIKYYYFPPKINGYEYDADSYKLANQQCDNIVAVLSYCPKSLPKQYYIELQNTLVSFNKPSNELINKLESASNMDKENNKMFNALIDALKHRNDTELSNISEECGINLKQNEYLYFKTGMSYLQRYETYSTNYASIGYRSNHGGIVGRFGTVVTKKNERMTTISSSGITYVTNKRIIYIDKATQKTYTIPFGRILNFYAESNAINIIVQDGKPYKFFMPMNYMYVSQTDTFYDNVFKMGTALANLLNRVEKNNDSDEIEL